jgi:hypothetical protein
MPRASWRRKLRRAGSWSPIWYDGVAATVQLVNVTADVEGELAGCRSGRRRRLAVHEANRRRPCRPGQHDPRRNGQGVARRDTRRRRGLVCEERRRKSRRGSARASNTCDSPLASSADATDMSKADLAQLKTRLKAQARYRWRRMEAALAAHDREAYAWHAAWRAAITKELRDLSDPILVALHNHPLRCARPSQRTRLRARMDRGDRHARQWQWQRQWQRR